MFGFFDLLVLITFIVIAYQLWKYSIKYEKSKNLLKLISIFIILHFVLFPSIYTILINNDPSSISIDNYIHLSEKNSVLHELVQEEKKLQNPEKILLEILKDSSDYKSMKCESGELIILDNYFLAITRDRSPKSYYSMITIFNDEGKPVLYVEDREAKLVIDVLNINFEKINAKKNQILADNNRTVKGQFWTYKMILPYSLNILFTSNFNPKTKLSNGVYFIHNIMVSGFILSLIIGYTHNSMQRMEKNKNSNN